MGGRWLREDLTDHASGRWPGGLRGRRGGPKFR